MEMPYTDRLSRVMAPTIASAMMTMSSFLESFIDVLTYRCSTYAVEYGPLCPPTVGRRGTAVRLSLLLDRVVE